MSDVRGVGAIILMTPGQVANSNTQDPLIGECCVDCLGMLALILDGLRGGRIRALAERMKLSGSIATTN